MEMICSRYLNIKFRKQKNLPRAFSEAKITMALYKKWKQINEMKEDPFHSNPNVDYSMGLSPMKPFQARTGNSPDFKMKLNPV